MKPLRQTFSDTAHMLNLGFKRAGVVSHVFSAAAVGLAAFAGYTALTAPNTATKALSLLVIPLLAGRTVLEYYGEGQRAYIADAAKEAEATREWVKTMEQPGHNKAENKNDDSPRP